MSTMPHEIELEDLPAIVAEVMNELFAGAEPFTIVENGRIVAVMSGMPEGRLPDEEEQT